MKSTPLLAIIVVSICLHSCQKNDTTSLIRMPYLQCALGDSLSILWRTTSGDAPKVLYKSETMPSWQEAPGLSRETNRHNTEHEVVLKNLPPNTPFQYRIFNQDQEWLPEDSLHFRTQKALSDSVFSFFAVGDIGEPLETGGTPDVLAKALEPAIHHLDFGLLLGDIIYPHGKSEDYDKNLFEHFEKVFPYLPVYPILGNHDWHNPDENYVQEWKLPGNEHYYSFDYGNVHFTALDSKKGEFYEYDKQVKWLEADLQKVQDKDWRVVYVHHNGNSCTYKEAYEAVVSLYPLFEEYHVDLVLNGHAHTYERLNPMDGSGKVVEEDLSDGARYQSPAGFVSITVGSGGKLRGVGSDPKPFTPDPENCQHPMLVAKAVHDWAYLQVAIAGRQLTGKVITTEDQLVVDEFVITK